MPDKNTLIKYFAAPINKSMVQPAPDGSYVTIKGVFTSDHPDMLGDIITRSATENALPAYRKWGNIRYMHQPRPVGKVTRIGSADGLEWNEVEFKIFDADVISQVINELLSALSVGIFIDMSSDVDILPNGGFLINSYTLSEISLVDHPANYDAGLAKSMSMEDARMKKNGTLIGIEKAVDEEPTDSVEEVIPVDGANTELEKDTPSRDEKPRGEASGGPVVEYDDNGSPISVEEELEEVVVETPVEEVSEELTIEQEVVEEIEEEVIVPVEQPVEEEVSEEDEDIDIISEVVEEEKGVVPTLEDVLRLVEQSALQIKLLTEAVSKLSGSDKEEESVEEAEKGLNKELPVQEEPIIEEDSVEVVNRDITNAGDATVDEEVIQSKKTLEESRLKGALRAHFNKGV